MKMKNLVHLLVLLFFINSSALASDVYVITRSRDFAKLPELFSNKKCLSGLTVYFSWRELQPENAAPDFSELNRVLRSVEQEGLRVNLAILPGRWSPSWLRDLGVQYMAWSHADSYVESGAREAASAPIPWDTVYLREYLKFMRSVSRELTHYKNINSLAMAGPSNTNGIEVAIIGDDRQLREIGFSPEKVVNAWKTVIDGFSQFPGNELLTLALHERYGSVKRNDISRELKRYAQEKLGARYVSMLLGFEGKSWFNKGNSYAGMLFSGNDFVGAVQSIKIYSKNGNRKDFEDTLDYANKLQSRWFEVWADDVFARYYSCQ